MKINGKKVSGIQEYKSLTGFVPQVRVNLALLNDNVKHACFTDECVYVLTEFTSVTKKPISLWELVY